MRVWALSTHTLSDPCTKFSTRPLSCPLPPPHPPTVPPITEASWMLRPLPPPLPSISTACAPASTFPPPLRPCLQPLSWPPHPTGASHRFVLSTAHTKSGHPSVQTPSMGLAHLVPKAFPPLDQPSSVLITHTPLLPQFLTGQAHPPGLASLSLLPSGLSQMPPPWNGRP